MFIHLTYMRFLLFLVTQLILFLYLSLLLYEMLQSANKPFILKTTGLSFCLRSITPIDIQDNVMLVRQHYTESVLLAWIGWSLFISKLQRILWLLFSIFLICAGVIYYPIYQPLRSGRIWHKVIFKRSLTGLNSEFSFS